MRQISGVFWMKKNGTVLLSVILLICTAGLSGCGWSEKQYLNSIAEEVIEQYMSNAYPAYIEKMREASGFEDLSFEPGYLSGTENAAEHGLYYSKPKNYVSATLYIRRLQSDAIDEWYHAQKSPAKLKLLTRMQEIHSLLSAGDRYTYTREDGVEVRIYVQSFSDTDCRIMTGDGTEYLHYQHNDYEWIDIDDETVYFNNGKTSSDSTDGKTGSGSNGSNSSGRGSSSSSGSKHTYSRNDPYNVDDYDDPDDFANDYEDEFDDYDDAYDYWEEEAD